jgi:hypothetical protein
MHPSILETGGQLVPLCNRRLGAGIIAREIWFSMNLVVITSGGGKAGAKFAADLRARYVLLCLREIGFNVSMAGPFLFISLSPSLG